MGLFIGNRRYDLRRIKFPQSISQPYEITVSSTNLPIFSKSFYLEFKVAGCINSQERRDKFSHRTLINKKLRMDIASKVFGSNFAFGVFQLNFSTLEGLPELLLFYFWLRILQISRINTNFTMTTGGRDVTEIMLFLRLFSDWSSNSDMWIYYFWALRMYDLTTFLRSDNEQRLMSDSMLSLEFM